MQDGDFDVNNNILLNSLQSSNEEMEYETNGNSSTIEELI